MTLVAAILWASPAAAQDARSLVAGAARRHGVEVSAAMAVAHVESGFNCRAVGSAGELGPMQIKPSTARAVGVPNIRHNCAAAVEASMRYLKMAVRRAGYTCAGFSLYNRGVYARPTCTAYGRRVLAAKRSYR